MIRARNNTRLLTINYRHRDPFLLVLKNWKLLAELVAYTTHLRIIIALNMLIIIITRLS